MCRSVPQMPAARTARSTCPGPGSGWDNFRRATFPSPRAVFMTACMVAMSAPPSSRRIERLVLPDIEGDGVVFQKAQQSVTFLGKREGSALREGGEGCNGKRGHLFLALHPPGPRDPSIYEERSRDTTVFRPPNELSMLVREHARPVRVREQQVVELRQKTRRRWGLLRRSQRIG